MAENGSTTPSPQEEGPHVIGFHLIKSQHFRTIHADGAFGGLTPQGNININLYSERPALPTYIEYSVDGKKLGEEDQSKRVSRDGIIREVEVGAVLSPRAARAIIVWLGIQLDKLESHKEKGADEA